MREKIPRRGGHTETHAKRQTDYVQMAFGSHFDYKTYQYDGKDNKIQDITKI